MNAGEIIAWHFASRSPFRLTWSDGTITALADAPVAPPKHRWVAPPLVDLQVNGYGGVDFQQDNLTLEELVAATRKLHAAGCGSYLLTLITDAWPALMARLRHLRNLRVQSPELRDAIAGWHIEGPFLSGEPGFCGAHDADAMCDPQPEHIRELRALTGDDAVLLTLAPERLDAIAAIAQAVSLGIKTSLGHTNAPMKRITQAIKAGATGFTHLGNGCPRDLDRHDNILWRAFETKGLVVGVIPDAIHVSPRLFRLMHRVLDASSIYYTTDAMAAAGAPPGRYQLGRLELEVGEDQVVRLPGRQNFAGSALKPVEGVFRAAHMLGCDWQEAWPRASATPARFMGLPHGLHVGAPATFCVVEVTPDNLLDELRVYVRGELIESPAATLP